MDNEGKTGAGRAVAQASKDIDRRHEDEDTSEGTGQDTARHDARESRGTRDESDAAIDADDEDREDDADEDDEDDPEDDIDAEEDEDDDRGPTPV